MRYIILEGMDRTGKSSLAHDLWKMNKINLVKERHILSWLVYNNLYKRNAKLEEYIKFLPDQKNVYIILLDINYDEYVKRCKKTNHEIVDEIKFNEEKMLFNIYFEFLKITYNNIIFIKINACQNYEDVVGDCVCELGL